MAPRRALLLVALASLALVQLVQSAWVTCGTKGAPPIKPPTKAGVLFQGRAVPQGADTLLGWEGTSVAARFQNAKYVLIKGTAIWSTTPHAINIRVTVDGVVCVPRQGWRDVMTDYKILLVDTGVHTVVVTKLTEGNIGQLLFKGFVTDGTIIAPPAPSKRLIEFVGDSITAGSGVVPANTTACLAYGDPKYNDVLNAYSGVTAAALGADMSVIAWSGKGVYKNLNQADTRTAPYFYKLANPADKTSLFTPKRQADVVVSLLGNNDIMSLTKGPTGRVLVPPTEKVAFMAAYAGLLKDVRKNYPKAKILLGVGPMVSSSVFQGQDRLVLFQDYVKSVILAANDTKMSYFEFPPIPAKVPGFPALSYTGCGGHPNMLYSSTVMSPILQKAIKAVTGWA